MSSRNPSIKGSAFLGLVADLKELVSDGTLTREELHERLAPPDVAFLDEEISPGFWYPMDSYDRILEVLVEELGGDDPRAYLLARGERAMKRMMELGLYGQFASLEKGWTRLSGRVMVTMANIVYNFLTFEIVSSEPETPSPVGSASDRFSLLIRDGGRLSDHALVTIEGAVATLAARAANGPVEVEGRRVAPDEIEVHAVRLKAGSED